MKKEQYTVPKADLGKKMFEPSNEMFWVRKMQEEIATNENRS